MSINERLKILISALNISARAFSQTIDVSESTTRNYLDKGTKPSADYLERIASHFTNVNLTWLITGSGEPLLTGSNSQVSHMRDNYGNSVGSNNKGGKVTQHHVGATNSGGSDDRDTRLALALQEIESLRAQLANKDALIAAKDETIDLLKSAYTRPN